MSTVATFTDPNGAHTGEYAATINWGDGTQSTGTISGPNGSGVYTVTGSHTYTRAEVPDTLSVTVVDNYASGISRSPAAGLVLRRRPSRSRTRRAAPVDVIGTNFVTVNSVISSTAPSTYGQL